MTKSSKRKMLKACLRRLLRGGSYKKVPDWVVLDIHNLGVPIQMEAERHGTKWEWCVYLEDTYEGVSVDGEECVRKALAHLNLKTSRVVNLRREKCDVRIDRTSKWGNQFRIGPDGNRDEVCDKYEAWLLTQIDLLRALEELRGKDLGCWCAPQRCHGDTLVRFLEEGIPWRKVPKIRLRTSD